MWIDLLTRSSLAADEVVLKYPSCYGDDEGGGIGDGDRSDGSDVEWSPASVATAGASIEHLGLGCSIWVLYVRCSSIGVDWPRESVNTT